jgi:hypothetical protein
MHSVNDGYKLKIACIQGDIYITKHLNGPYKVSLVIKKLKIL